MVLLWETAAGRRNRATRRAARLDPDRARRLYQPCPRPDGRVAMQRTANPCTAVRFRFRPPTGLLPRPSGPALIPGSSVVEQAAVNRWVDGSNPSRGANHIRGLDHRWSDPLMPICVRGTIRGNTGQGPDARQTATDKRKPPPPPARLSSNCRGQISIAVEPSNDRLAAATAEGS